jgi:hypothetical protein
LARFERSEASQSQKFALSEPVFRPNASFRTVCKKFENHAHLVAIYAVWYNWIRIHTTLRVTPAMAAGLSDTVMDWAQIVEAMDADTPAKKRGPYKKTVAQISN